MKSGQPVISLEEALDTVLVHAERLPPVDVALKSGRPAGPRGGPWDASDTRTSRRL